MTRLVLDPIPLDLTAAAPASGDEGPRRQIAGLAVPYETEARVGDQLVTVAGSVEIAGAPPLLFGHDPTGRSGSWCKARMRAVAAPPMQSTRPRTGMPL
jgi:hypothetical protein